MVVGRAETESRGTHVGNKLVPSNDLLSVISRNTTAIHGTFWT